MAQHLVFFCPTCGEARYRSVKELEIGESISPAMFRPIGDAPPPPQNGPPLCFACQSMMKLMPEETALQFHATAEGGDIRARSRAQGQAGGDAPAPGYDQAPNPADIFKNLTFDIFKCGPNEEILKVDDVGAMLLITTNRRITGILKSGRPTG